MAKTRIIWLILAIPTVLVRAGQMGLDNSSHPNAPSQDTSSANLTVHENWVRQAPPILLSRSTQDKITVTITVGTRYNYKKPPPPPNRKFSYKNIPTITIPWSGIAYNNLETQMAVAKMASLCKKCIIVGINETHIVVQEHLLRLSQRPPIQENKNCKYSLEEVEKIAQILKNTNEGAANGDVFAAPSYSQKSECVQVLQKIKKNSEELRVILNQMKKDQGSHTAEDFLKMQNAYKEKIAELKREIDLVRMGANQEAQLKIHKMLEEQQRLARSLNEALEKLERQAREIEANNHALLTYALKEGDFSQALKSFEQMQNKKNVPELVRKMFTTERFESVLIFVATIPNEHLEIKRAIIDMVTKHVETASSDNYLILWEYRKCFPNDGKESNINFVFNEAIQSDAIEARWQFAKYEEHEYHVLRFAEDRPGVLDRMWLSLLNYKLYATQNMTSSLEFANKLPPNQATTFRYYLYKQGVQMGRVFSLRPALQIAHQEYKHLKKYGESDLWKQVERTVALIASGEPTCIGQSEAQRVLYQAGQILFFSPQFAVYARPMHKKPPQEVTSMWRFEPVDSDSMSVFKIKSDPSGRPLYPAYYGYKYSRNRRRILAWGNIQEDFCEDKWQLRDDDTTNIRETFQIYNKCYNEYLHVETNSESDDPQLASKVYTISSSQPPYWTTLQWMDCKN